MSGDTKTEKNILAKGTSTNLANDNPSQKLRLIQQQKKQLKQKIVKLESKDLNQSTSIKNKPNEQQDYEKTMAILQQKKKKLEHQKREQEKLQKMQNQYIERSKQMQREKQLEKINNQKRLIELEVGMKRIVFDGVKEKVKGMNSQQLMARAFLSDPNQKHKHLKTKENIKNQFEKYLKNEDVKRQKQKYDVFQLNNKRLEIFEKKQEIVMREVLLKQIMSRENNNNQEIDEDDQPIDVMKMNRQQLQQMFQQYGLDLDDYIHPIPTKQIVQNYQGIKQQTRQQLLNQFRRIKHNEKQISNERVRRQKDQKQRHQIKMWVKTHQPQENIELAKGIIQQVVDRLVLDYERRHMEGTVEQKQGRIKILEQEYQKIIKQTQGAQISKYLVDDLSYKLYIQTLQEVAVQIQQLHSFAHQKTQECLKFLFNKQSFLPQIMQASSIPIQLNFRHQSQEVNFTDGFQNQQKDQYLKKINQPKQNIFQTQTLTSQLINDLNLLSGQEEYFQKIQTKFSDQTNIQIEGDFKIYFKRDIYLITKDYVKSLMEEVTKDIEFRKPITQINSVQKTNKNWVIQNKNLLLLGTTWNYQVLPMEIGQRINSPSGYMSTAEVYPVFTLLGGVCSVLIGFEKGQILKYNFNMNRITGQQTNISHYLPLIPNVKTGDQVAFPLNHRNIISYKHNKVKDNQQIHEFRQFFDHHSVQIIGLHFYRPNMFLSVDKFMKCAIWNYEPRLGVKSFEPIYTFQIRSTYKIFKQSQNPRFRDLFPSDGVTDTPQQMYVRWMQTESFLKNQIYNNPKKKLAYFKSPKWQDDKTEQPIWKISYDDQKRKIVKIYQSYHNVLDGRTECKSSKIWKQYLMLMVQRDHVMRPDLKTIKIYCWNIQQKKLRSVGIQFDMYKDQKTADFAVMQNHIDSIDMQLLAVISSGRIMLFSLTSGQLIRNLSDSQYLNNAKYSKYYFNNIIATDSYFVASTVTGVMKIILEDKNSQADKSKFIRVIQLARKKYLNLI